MLTQNKGATALLSPVELGEMGYKLVAHPSDTQLAALFAIKAVLKTLKESDGADNLTLGVADQLENAASQAAPGSAPFLTATAVTASIRSQALTQKMLAAELRQEAAHLAHVNALRKQGATFASQVSTSIQNTLQPQ